MKFYIKTKYIGLTRDGFSHYPVTSNLDISLLFSSLLTDFMKYREAYLIAQYDITCA